MFYFKQKTAYGVRISDWSSDVCSSDLERDVQAVGADQREERRQIGAALRAGAFGDQVMELVDFHADEAGPEQEGDAQPADHAAPPARVQVQHGHAEGEAADQQQHGLDQHERKLEQFGAGGAAGGGFRQDG